MSQQNSTDRKIVIVIAEGTAAARAANVSALLALTIGARHQDLIGPDVPDADGRMHAGISDTPVPVLVAPASQLAELAQPQPQPPIEVIGFTKTAAGAHTYDKYTRALAAVASADLDYLAVALIGPRAQVTSLTGSLPLFR
ncbi:DUF2000 domain-containing protein [Actinomyces ruminicola]|uniref:DUF2000 domain-containing protein n=1 Tax=Actinomyces ruminicola TaxID=332524 RepID=A0A1G9X001_9ACTO|nr:DUF2000 domain-containing protein [Actinomyces ruminicola]SDM90154.1 Protein of unknown function [Actinomyces ruminicola]